MLIQEQPAQSKQMTLDEFLDWYPEGQGRLNYMMEPLSKCEQLEHTNRWGVS